MKYPAWILTFCLLLQAHVLRAQEIDSTQRSLFPLPLLFWTPETEFGGGALVSYILRNSRDTLGHPTSMSVQFIYTQNKQISFFLGGDHYWNRGARHYSGAISYSKFPYAFYGIGPDTPDTTEKYDPESVSIVLSGKMRVSPHLYAGLRLEWDHTKLLDAQNGGQLASGKIRGTQAGYTSGLGATVHWDTRNDVIYPRQGSFHQASVIPFTKFFGSDFKFVRTQLDFRQYFPLFKNHVFAYQVNAVWIAGHPPFHKMALFGGPNLMRGYYEGRFRDRQFFAFQTEYRAPVWWRFGLAAFGGYGDVAHRLDEFRFKSFKYSIGWGLRFLLDKDQNLNLRIDLAYGKHSAFPAIGIGEAF